MIRIVQEGCRSYVSSICDYCGKPIDDATDGNYEWKTNGQGKPLSGRVYFTHKRCCNRFEQSRDGTEFWACCELSLFPLRLAANLNMDDDAWDEAKRSAYALSCLP